MNVGGVGRAWVPIKECYLFSKDPPSPPKNRSKSLDACIEVSLVGADSVFPPGVSHAGL